MDEDDEAGCGDEACGCDWVDTVEIDGRRVEVHHVWPDDGAPHSPTSECGCGPQRHEVDANLVVYDHVDQDSDAAAYAELTQ